MTMLSETRRLVMAPSSNLPQASDHSWLYLLPDLHHVICLGVPPADVLAALHTAIDQVSIVTASGPLEMDGEYDALIIATDDQEMIDRAAVECQAMVDGGARVVRLRGSARYPGELGWIAFDRRHQPSKPSKRVKRLSQLLHARLTTMARRPTVASARRHASDVAFLMFPQAVRPEPDQKTTSMGARRFDLPRYIRDIASVSGYELDLDTWDFGPPRGFASQKIVFRIGGVTESPSMIIKITQDARFNDRLDSEDRALAFWSKKPQQESFVIPTPLLRGLHGDRLMVGQRALAGRPFRVIAEPDPDAAIPGRGFRSIVEMAAASVQPTGTGESSEAFSGVVHRFASIFSPPPPVAGALDEAAQRLSRFEVPTVFMHGDLGIWNLLVEPDGRIGVLDWENGDPQGVPLWDLFVYSRTLGVFLADARGQRYSTAVFARQLLGESTLRHTMFEWIQEYRRHVDIPTIAVDDLFTLCWAQQAIREAASLAAPAWSNSAGTRIV
ncbi:MAG: aminoglycoside phosphotransferase family protein, partial [Acidimicrobiia bacterium]|nr:aminoglycoside phosphotransferase family protein [Acidimicrobiia bacterium]